MRVAYILAASLIPIVAPGSPHFTNNDYHLEARQQEGTYYAVTGATGGLFPRLEIRELESAGGEMWNLFLLALTEFQAMDQHVIDSYFQIAGIHGMPWTSWDGVQGRLENVQLEDGTIVQRNPGMGYCPHFQVMFGTWHRPYLLLFEQKLQSVAKAIANRFPIATRNNYQDAATKLRVPFWDWAKAIPYNQPVIPLAVSNEKARVTFPNGTAALIDNPLFDYNFHPLDHTQINGTGCPLYAGFPSGQPQICQEYTRTIRGGSYLTGSDQAGVNARLRSDLASQRSRLFAIFSQYQSFTQITSDQVCSQAGTIGSLESVHNNIHVHFAPGHMTPPDVAAFDPIFWLHHANVDRQLALHQALYPDAYLEPCVAGSSTFTVAAGDVLNADSPLMPFHRTTAGAFWTSRATRNIHTQGYTYPELFNNPSNATLIANIKAQYSGPSNVLVTSMKPQIIAKQCSNTTAQEKTLYFAEVQLPMYGLDNGKGGSLGYSVLVFVGNVNDDARKWSTSESLVGTAASLGGVHMQSDQIVTSTIDLSLALEKAVAAGKTTMEKAGEYLRGNVKYRVGLGGKEIRRSAVANLRVRLISTRVEMAQSEEEFDRWVGGFVQLGVVEC